MFLLDTNVVSELRKAKRANDGVRAWATKVSLSQQYVSAITILELEQGVLTKERKDAAQGQTLRDWLDNIVRPQFAGRIVSVDEAVALSCAYLHVPDQKSYRDSLIGACALIHGLTLVTRNIKDFRGLIDKNKNQIKLINPWETT